MEIKNLFTKQAQDTYSAVTGGIKKKIKPVVDMGSELVRQNVEAVKPAIQSVADTVNTSFVEPIVKPIQQAQQKSEKIGKINTFFSEKGITIDDIKALAEEEGLDANEVISKFQRNGIKVQGMEDLQTQEDTKVQEEANKPFAVDVSPEYDEVTALSRLTGAIPKFQYSPDEGFLKTAGKMVGNLFPSAVQVAGGIGDIGLSYARNIDQGPIDAFTETAKAKIINPTIAQAYGIKDVAKEGYKEGGIIGSANKLLEKGTEFIVENPVGAIMTGKGVSGLKRGGVALKTAGTEAMKGNIGKATAGLAKSIGIGLKENIYDPIKMGVTAPITVAKLGAKGIGAIARKTGIKAPEGVQNVSNNMAEEILSSQWKLTKPIRKELEGKIGQSGPKFALENDLIGKDIESTADNAGAFKIEKIKQKIDAVKTFGKTETPSVAKNVAQVLKSDIESSVQKSYGKGKTQKILDENHPELASVYRLADEIINSKDIDYVKLEQLKELHDYLNPENIQYDISGKPISETRNILSAGKRQKLQQILEAEGQKRGIDIKKINKDIQGAYTLEKGLNDTVGRIANLNILGLGDTQTAVISSILGGAPGAVGGILLKKGLTSEGFVGGLAKSLYSKKNVATNNGNPSGTMTPPVTRLGRIMNNNSDTINSKVESKGITPKPKTEGVKPSPQVKPVEKTSATQANGPSVLGKMGKVETNTTLQSPTSYEEGMRRPFTMGNNKPIVKRASDSDNGLIEEARKYKSAEEFVKKYTLDSNLPPEATTFTKIPLNKIRGLDYPELEDALIKGKTLTKSQIEDIISPTDDFVKGKQIKNAIELIKNKDGTYSLMGGNHRVAQAILNGDKEILSWYSGLKGEINLKQIYEQAKSPQKTVKPLTPKKQSATMGDMENPIVNKQTGETLNQAIEKLRKNNWSEKDISKFRESVLGKKENIVKKEGVLDTVNPTGGLFVDYTPSKRANSIISSKALTTLDKTLGKSPDDYITIYRGTVKGQKEMNPGDFVTDLPELAKSYAGGDKIVISKRVKYSDIIDSIEDGGANEYLYIPKEMQKWDNKQKSIVKPLTPKKQSATMGDMETKKLIEEAKGFSIEPILKEFNEKSRYFKNSGIKVKSLKLDGNIDNVVRNGKKLKEGWSYVEQKTLGKTEKTQGWYIEEPLNPIGGGKTITAIRADGVGIRVSLPDGYKSIEGTVVRDFVMNVIDRNPFIDTKIKNVAIKKISPQ